MGVPGCDGRTGPCGRRLLVVVVVFSSPSHEIMISILVFHKDFDFKGLRVRGGDSRDFFRVSKFEDFSGIL